VKAVLDRIFARYSSWNRARKARYIADFIAERGVRSVLVVGVGRLSPTKSFEQAVERRIADAVDLFITSGLATEAPVPHWTYLTANGMNLPFPDDAFDLVFSNAVLEHVGDEHTQRRFVAEHVRVGRHFVLTTPNRWFPVEAHTRTVFRHWSAAWRARQRKFTRLVSRKELDDLLTVPGHIRGHAWSPTFVAFGPTQPAPATIDLTDRPVDLIAAEAAEARLGRG